MHIIYKTDTIHGKSNTEFVLVNINEEMVEFQNVNLTFKDRDVSISPPQDCIPSLFEWRGVIKDKDTSTMLLTITSDKRIPLKEYFEIDSGVFLKMGPKYDGRWGIWTIVIQKSIFNDWKSKCITIKQW